MQNAILWLCLLLVAGCAHAAASADADSVAETLAERAKAPVLKSPPQAMVDEAKAIGLIRFDRRAKGGAHTNRAWSGGGVIPLAVAAYAGNTTADAALLRQIRYNLEGENAISANGGYPAQHERHFTGACTLAKLTPRVWSKLSKEEKHKIDLAMTAALVASAYTTSDKSYADGKRATGIDGNVNLHRGWNPNFQEGMVGMMPVGVVYFGPEGARQILDTFDHAAFVKGLKAAGLTNIHETFTWKAAHPDSAAPTGKQIEEAIKDYTWHGLDLTDPMAFYVRLTENTYGATVNAGLNGGKGKDGGGRIASGADELPNKGKPGMLKEFASVDGGGPRSSITYAYDGFRPNLTNQIVLIAGGYWDSGQDGRKCVELLDVGIEDLFYKLRKGYINYAKGKASKKVFSIQNPHWGFGPTRSLWYDVLRPYHRKAAEGQP